MTGSRETSKAPRPVVIVIDDDGSVRSALANLLDSVGIEARPFAAVDEFLAAPLPEADMCLVLDIRMPNRNGLEVLEDLARTHAGLPVVMISAHGDIPMSVRAMKAGAIEFLPKPFREQDLLDAISVGLSQSRARREAVDADAALRTRLASLSRRERQVLDLVADGQLTKQIAADLGLSEITVKLCRAAMMRKMGVGSLVELGRIAERVRAGKAPEL